MEELFTKLGVKIPDFFSRNRECRIETRPAGNIHRTENQRFIHRQHHAAEARNSAHFAQCRTDCTAEADPDIFRTVMIIDIRIAHARQAQIKSAVPCEKDKHMIQETAARINFSASCSVQIQAQPDRGFRSCPFDICSSHILDPLICSEICLLL